MISLQQTPLSIDGEALFTIPKFIFQDRDRVGLIAANGLGKTTFLHALANKSLPHNATIALCPQKTPLEWLDQSWNDRVMEAPPLFQFQLFYDLTDQFQISVERPLSTLSGGQQRLGLICYVACQQAMHYLFDEPTNHLDLPTIAWLEKFLQKHCASYMIISHDRAFLEAITQGCWAIHENLLRYYAGNFEAYLEKRQEEEQSLEHQRQRNEVRLSQEERYRERGVTGRRKRNQKRVERLHELRDILSQTNHVASMNLQQTSSGAKGARPQQLIRFINYKPAQVFKSGEIRHDTTIERALTRSDRIVLVGPNGCGKTTFLKAIQNQVEGIEYCRPLVIESIDQHRLLDPKKTLLEHLTDDPHQITLQTSQGIQTVHPASYLEPFALTRNEFSIPYAKLSGGQQIKLCLALALMKNPDVLILDEPTNDLDSESLEELADWMAQYQGLVIVVSHDRYFIDQCATETWYWTTNGIYIHTGGIDSHLLARLETLDRSTAKASKSSKESKQNNNSGSDSGTSEPQSKKVEKIEKRIAQLETELAELNHKMLDYGPEEYNSPTMKKCVQKHAELSERLEKTILQWEELSP